MAEFTTKQRENLADKDQAMPDGSFPIRNRTDLKNAIKAYGRAKDKAAAKRWIMKRARELDAEDLIPDIWKSKNEVEHSDDELYHHGVKGMKWGIRRDRKKSSTLKSYRTSRKNDPKTDVLKINRPNSAARSYYRGERTHSFTTYKKQQSIMNQKISGLTKAEIENGRYRVARARNIKRKAASGVMGVAVGALVNPALAPVVALGANWLTGGHYYQGQSATYGSRRADRENKRKS